MKLGFERVVGFATGLALITFAALVMAARGTFTHGDYLLSIVAGVTTLWAVCGQLALRTERRRLWLWVAILGTAWVSVVGLAMTPPGLP